jgi:hypothetical protein
MEVSREGVPPPLASLLATQPSQRDRGVRRAEPQRQVVAEAAYFQAWGRPRLDRHRLRCGIDTATLLSARPTARLRSLRRELRKRLALRRRAKPVAKPDLARRSRRTRRRWPPKSSTPSGRRLIARREPRRRCSRRCPEAGRCRPPPRGLACAGRNRPRSRSAPTPAAPPRPARRRGAKHSSR